MFTTQLPQFSYKTGEFQEFEAKQIKSPFWRKPTRPEFSTKLTSDSYTVLPTQYFLSDISIPVPYCGDKHT